MHAAAGEKGLCAQAISDGLEADGIHVAVDFSVT